VASHTITDTRVSWTKVDQSDFYALCVIDPALAEKVKRIANEQRRHFRDVLRSAVNQMEFDRRGPLKEFWDSLTPEERSEHSRQASLKRWATDAAEKRRNRVRPDSQKHRGGS
jgi:hypothetical protein